jgi:hypothetical protein
MKKPVSLISSFRLFFSRIRTFLLLQKKTIVELIVTTAILVASFSLAPFVTSSLKENYPLSINNAIGTFYSSDESSQIFGKMSLVNVDPYDYRDHDLPNQSVKIMQDAFADVVTIKAYGGSSSVQSVSPVDSSTSDAMIFLSENSIDTPSWGKDALYPGIHLLTTKKIQNVILSNSDIFINKTYADKMIFSLSLTSGDYDALIGKAMQINIKSKYGPEIQYVFRVYGVVDPDSLKGTMPDLLSDNPFFVDPTFSCNGASDCYFSISEKSYLRYRYLKRLLSVMKYDDYPVLPFVRYEMSFVLSRLSSQSDSNGQLSTTGINAFMSDLYLVDYGMNRYTVVLIYGMIEIAVFFFYLVSFRKYAREYVSSNSCFFEKRYLHKNLISTLLFLFVFAGALAFLLLSLIKKIVVYEHYFVPVFSTINLICLFVIFVISFVSSCFVITTSKNKD